MKHRNLVLAVAAVLVLGLAVTSYAGWGAGQGRGGCPGWGGQGGRVQQQLTPEQLEKLQIIQTEHFNKVEPLRKSILAKHFELEALMVEPEVNSAKIKSIAKDLGELKAKMFEVRIDYRKSLAEIGIQNFGPRGMGRGFGPCGGGTDCPRFGGARNGNCPGGGPCGGPGRGPAPCPSGNCG